MKLKSGSIVHIHGWVMLAKLQPGTYRIKAHPPGRYPRSVYSFYSPRGRRVIVSHYADSVDAWIRRTGHPDSNRIEVVSE